MSERHAFFFGFDPDLECFRSNLRYIEERVKGNYIVICGHCRVSLCGTRVDTGPTTEIVWRHDGGSWFGTFSFPETVTGES